MNRAIVLNKRDNVATATEKLKKGMDINITIDQESKKVKLKSDIPFGHKFALKKIRKKDKVIKYGHAIGVATSNIDVGKHVHVHNIESSRGRGDLN